MNPTGKATRARARSAAICALAVAMLGAIPLAGCRGDRENEPPRRFFPDMDHQPKIKAQSEADFFADGNANRMPVEGTVSFGHSSVIPGEGPEQGWVSDRARERAAMLKDDEPYYYGMVAGSADSETPSYIERMPVSVTEEMVELGAEQFNIYCAACHGYDALGNDSGTVGRLLNVRPVNLLDDRYRDRRGEFGSDGYLYHVIRAGLWSPDGSNRMPAYGHAVDEDEAWAIVAYIRVLQAAFDAEGNPSEIAAASDTPNAPMSGQMNGGEQ